MQDGKSMETGWILIGYVRRKSTGFAAISAEKRADFCRVAQWDNC